MINTYDLFEGTLRLGDGPLSCAGQVRACRLETTENVTTREPVPVLSGEEIAGGEDVTFSRVLAGTILQDLIADGVVDWSWDNAGTEQEFVFAPADAAQRAVSGVLKPVPLMIGGDVTKSSTTAGDPPTSDFSWRVVGEPVFGVYDPVTFIVTPDV